MPIATRERLRRPQSRSGMQRLLGQPQAEVASIIVSVGLAQNFAALKALVSTGIEAGHMKLQAKSLALQAGAQDEEIAGL